MKQNVKRLILNMLLAREDSSLSVQDIIRACGMFGVKAANVRVVLQRLVAESLLESKERGNYQLGPAATNVIKAVSAWKDNLEKLDTWHGDWIGIHCGALNRSDRNALKTRERALKLLGCQELSKGMYVRPNNLKGGIHGIHLRLNSLGLSGEVPIFRIADFDIQTTNKLNTLWDTNAIEQNYKTTSDELLQWIEKLNTLSAERAATESFLLGDKGIRQMIYDPLLPEEMINTKTREMFARTLKLFDDIGQDIWNSLIDRTPIECRSGEFNIKAQHLLKADMT